MILSIYGEKARAEVQPSGHTTKLAFISAPGRNVNSCSYLMLTAKNMPSEASLAMGQGMKGTRFLEAIQVSSK